MDHPLHHERPKANFPLVHERIGDIANVPMSVNRKGSPFVEDAYEPSVLLVRLQDSPDSVIDQGLVEILKLIAGEVA